ncbi:RNA polymerase sigma factor [Nonomuraea angiospora]|uniref:RNA polymerase sigma factor n=1 Tax=Nonomuraea angiospora TaxID=46172 RepID=UPI0029C9BE0A|nr:sigma factor-like helix-turn-helix DNA-binding protein [Nonomuraea angiospora]
MPAREPLPRRGTPGALAVRLCEEIPNWANSVTGAESADEAFKRLPDDDRELLALVAWEGLNGAEIAKVLGCSPAS